MSEPYVRTTVHLYRKIHGYFVEEIGQQNVSEFFRLVEEELLAQPGEDRNLSLQMRAAKATEMAKQRYFQQRRLLQDEETQKAEAAKKAEENRAIIERETIRITKDLNFKPEWLRDTQALNFSHHRKELVDEVTFACGVDLQWKDIAEIVRKAVLP